MEILREILECETLEEVLLIIKEEHYGYYLFDGAYYGYDFDIHIKAVGDFIEFKVETIEERTAVVYEELEGITDNNLAYEIYDRADFFGRWALNEIFNDIL